MTERDRNRYTGFRLVRVREGQRPVETVPVKVDPPPTRNPFALLIQARAYAGKREWQKAAQAYARAVELTDNATERAFLLRRRAALV